MRGRILQSALVALLCLNGGWKGLEVKPLEKTRSELLPGQSGTYEQLSDAERKELVWMAKAAMAAYLGEEKPLGYRSFSRGEWDACSRGCQDLVYTEDGYFTVGSGLRGRLMVNMLNEGRVILALCGTEQDELLKDLSTCVAHYFNVCRVPQYEQAYQLMQGVLACKPSWNWFESRSEQIRRFTQIDD